MMKFFRKYILLFFVLTTSLFYAQDKLINPNKSNTIINNVNIFNKDKDTIKGIDQQDKLFTEKFEISLSQFSNTSSVNFSSAKFLKSVTLNKVIFNSKVNFTYTKFNTIVKINKSKFNNNTYFTDATFNDVEDFSKTEFNEYTDFSNVRFCYTLFFNDAKFNAEVDFTNAILPDSIDFTNAKIINEIDLTTSKIEDNGICNINLVGATISNIRFRYKRFKLYFEKKDASNYELKSSVYEALLNKQSTEGFTDSYEKLDKEYKAFKYTDKGYGHGKWGVLQNWVDKNWWGYGYNKELIVLNSILLYLFFSFLNAFFLKHLTDKVYKSEKINEYLQETKSEKFILFIKSVPFSLFYTAQIFFGYKFDMDKLNYKENLQGWEIFNLLYFFVIYLSGLVCLAYLMNYVLTV